MSLTDAPQFTVIMATFGRGRHILPSIRSVLRQTLTRFELLVIGDACDDDTGDVVAAVGDARVRWTNLATRHFSQTGPNNEGIRQARGSFIAYIGHDDVWEPDHLSSLATLFRTRPGVDFGISGMISHMPPGVPGTRVVGMFTRPEEKHVPVRHHFPPTCVAHRRSVPDRIGLWRMPDEIQVTPDADFELRAIDAGMRFASTQRITAHKFSAGRRYLSYLDLSSDEQEAMLADLDDPGHADRIAALVATSRQEKTYMKLLRRNPALFAPGELARRSHVLRGLERADLRLLTGPEVFRQEPTSCALDWIDVPVGPVRWSRMNPAPRLLLPYACAEPVALVAHVYHPQPEGLDQIVLHCNAERHVLLPQNLVRSGQVWRADFPARVTLLPDAPTVLRFDLRPDQVARGEDRGIGLGDMTLCPVSAVVS